MAVWRKPCRRRRQLCCNEKMEQAVQELENILRCLKIGGNEEKVNLDFSIVNDMDYYTGIIFQGFIQRCAQQHSQRRQI